MKGQVSYEFLGTVMIAVLIYAIFAMYIYATFGALLPWDNQNYEAGCYATRIADKIDGAYLAGEGYYSSFEMPEQIRGRDYIIHYDSSGKAVEIDIIDLGEIDSYAVANFVANGVYMVNVGNGTNYISNNDGTVVVWRP